MQNILISIILCSFQCSIRNNLKVTDGASELISALAQHVPESIVLDVSTPEYGKDNSIFRRHLSEALSLNLHLSIPIS